MDRRSFLKTSVLGAAALSLGGLKACKVKYSYDTLIKNGVIYTGDGGAPLKGDMAIREGRIAAIGQDLGESAREVLDARGMAVSPGFIDIHVHTDTNLLVAPKGDSRIFQGITSEVGGNCGYSPVLSEYPSVESFHKRLSDNKVGINYCTLVGHGDVREAVVGPYNVKATDAQLQKMCDILDEHLSQGAVDLSYGLEYAPGCYSDTREMIALNKVVARHDKLYSIHMRNEDDHVLEAMDEAIEAARAEGIDIGTDRYPYTAFSTGFDCFIPIELRDGTPEDIMARLQDKAACEKMRRYMYGRLERFGGPEKVVVAGCRERENAVYAGKNLAECCLISGLDEWEMVRHLLLSEHLDVNQATFAMKEENLLKIYAHPLAMPASDGLVYSPEGPLSEGLPHPRSYGTFPRFFEKYVREQKLLDLSTAIYKCTALPASRAHIKGRGRLVPGYWADITIFNPETIADRCTYAKPHTFPAGILHVFVNGVAAIRDGVHTGALAGSVGLL